MRECARFSPGHDGRVVVCDAGRTQVETAFSGNPATSGSHPDRSHHRQRSGAGVRVLKFPAGVGQRDAAPALHLEPAYFHTVGDDALKLLGRPDAAPGADHHN